MRKQLPLLIATVFGFLLLVRFFVPSHGMERLESIVLLYFRIIGGFAMILGIASLVRINWIRIQRRHENWPYGIVTISGFAVMFVVGTFGGLFIPKPTTLKLAFDGGDRGVASMSDDRKVLTLSRASGAKLTLQRVGDPTPVGQSPYPGEWRFEPAPPAPATESAATESAPKTEAPAEPPPPVTASIAPGSSGSLQVGGEPATSFSWTEEGAGRYFRAGISREKNKVFDWIFQWIYIPMDSTIFSLLAFYIASAAFRSMRARDITSSLLLAAAVLVMLGRAPLTAYLWDLLVHPAEGTWLWNTLVHPFDAFREAHPFFTKHHIPSLGQVTEWLMSYPNTAAKRAVMFGAGLAALAQSLRILVGIERPYMAGTGD